MQCQLKARLVNHINEPVAVLVLAGVVANEQLEAPTVIVHPPNQIFAINKSGHTSIRVQRSQLARVCPRRFPSISVTPSVAVRLCPLQPISARLGIRGLSPSVCVGPSPSDSVSF